MNDDLFASIHVDASVPAPQMAALVAELTGGEADGARVRTPWATIAVDDDYGDFEIRSRDPGHFLGWRVLLEVMPPDDAGAEEVVARVTGLMQALLARGLPVLASCDYADQLPGGGEVVRPPT